MPVQGVGEPPGFRESPRAPQPPPKSAGLGARDRRNVGTC